MAEGVAKTEAVKFTEVWRTTWETPYIMRLALSAGIGGLLFGYNTGVISGALLYIKEDFGEVDQKTWLQEIIVSMTAAGAIVGAAIGGWYNDKSGRRISVLIADVLFIMGAIVMVVAHAPWVIIVGRLLVGFGVGMASMTSPLYISEMSPARIRGALVSTNGLLITGGQFLSYLINLAFVHTPGTWRWMLGVSAIPAIIQFCLMLSLPESPRWLYRNDRKAESRDILERIYPAEKVEAEIAALKESVLAETADEDIIGHSYSAKLRGALSNPVVRHGLAAGVTVQVAQQFVGINTVMYYSPTILQFAGYASNKTAMALALITSGLNAVGSVVSMMFVDRYGRRKLMIISMFGIISCLISLAVVFNEASNQAPKIDTRDSRKFAPNATCPAFVPFTASHAPPSNWNCMKCLRYDCGFCSNSAQEYAPGACVVLSGDMKALCHSKGRTYFKDGCPSKFGYLAIVFLGLYIIVYAPGMGTVPWIVNSEIYPLRYRGLAGGIAAVSNWTSNLIVSETFLTLTQAVGSSGTFLLFAGSSTIGLFFIWLFVPETKGLQFEEVEKLLEGGFRPSLLRPATKASEVEMP
ncbi:PREDICTED: probable inositol transporter 3 [Camelina sativa]|uniref:Probable inositol transporter 3 n=1 Tax=Camelina sativa TaxID=90675 RepID=A0ABM0ZJV4_CAMSA|nr:PREDICTED: probable inositol transporter 3 [Camelina sativa]